MARRQALILIAILALVVGSAGRAAPKDGDFELGLFVKKEVSPLVPYIDVPNGGTVTVPWRTFVLIVGVRLAPEQPEHAHLHVELGNGLTWGAENPSQTTYCTGTASTADCDTMPSRPDDRGPTEEDFGPWDVTAMANGRYAVRAQLTEPSVADPVLSNNQITATLAVREVATTIVGNVSLTPAKPKAGSAVTATVKIFTTASPPRPTGLKCSGRVGTTPLRGTPIARPGKAMCLYRPPRSAKGKTLSGSVSFTAAGKRYAKPFRVRLG